MCLRIERGADLKKNWPNDSHIYLFLYSLYILLDGISASCDSESKVKIATEVRVY